MITINKAGLAQDSTWGRLTGPLAMSDQDPGVRSQMGRFELGRVVLDVLAESLPNELFRWSKEDESAELSTPVTPVSAEEHDAEHETFWHSHDGMATEIEFHNRLLFLSGELAKAYNQLDLAVVQNRLERLLWLEPVLDNEGMLALYETMYVIGCLPVAGICSDYFMFDPGYMIVEASIEVLNAKRARRAALGMAPRPDSEAWYRIYEVLATLKWKGPECDKNRLIPMDELLSSYLTVENRCLEFLASHPAPDPQREGQVKTGLGWCLLQVIKAAMRHMPQLTKELIAHFNAIHGPILEPEPGHFLRYASTQRIDPWYWDFELYKMCTETPVSDEEANLCYQWRLDSMRRRERQDDRLRSFKLGAKNELEVWTSNIRRETTTTHREVIRAS